MLVLRYPMAASVQEGDLNCTPTGVPALLFSLNFL